MENNDFPSLFASGDLSSNKSQAHYLRLLKFQYLGIILAGLCLYFFPNFRSAGFLYLLLVFFSLSLSVSLFWLKPEKDWYKYRALAESIKTRTWLFIMKADPFSSSLNIEEVQIAFKNDIIAIWEANSHVRNKKISLPDSDHVVSNRMLEVRKLTISKRKEFYLKYRVRDQQNWYRTKSKLNDKKFKIWAGIAVTLYLIAFSLIFDGLAYNRPNGFIFSPAVFLVAASSAIGWIQIKKFNELAAAYSLTAHEISLAKADLKLAKTEQQFGDAIEEIELVFSREHTQWVARQQ